MQITQETAEKIHAELMRANQLLNEGKKEEAKTICLSVYDLCPEYPDTNQILGLIHLQDLEFFAAADYFQKAVEIFPEQPFVWLRLGQALVETRQVAAAEEAFKTSLKYAPNSAEAHQRLGELQIACGNLAEARASLRKAFQINPKMTSSLRHLARIVDKDDAAAFLTELKALSFDLATLSPLERANAAFALGCGLEKLGKGNQALDFFQISKTLQTRPDRSWFQDFEGFFEKSKLVFSKDFLARALPVSAKKITPIFIVGPPRSGSTLLEQLLANHSKIAAAGEVRFSEALFKKLEGLLRDKPYPDGLPEISRDQLLKLSGEYQGTLQRLAPGKTIFVDKMLSNFHVLGLFKILFPWARVINISRNKDDTAVSILKNVFSIYSAPYLSSPSDFGLYFHMYEDLMAFWHDRLPGFILDVKFEDLVSDPKVEVKRILEFCGLETEAACLDLKGSQNPVFTPSTLQVREPVHRRGIGAAKGHDDFLVGFHSAYKRKRPYSLTPSPEIQNKLLRVRDHISESLFKRALKLCREVLAVDPEQPDAWRAQAKIHSANHEYDEAADALKKSLLTSPNQPEVWVELGNTHNFLRNFEAAEHAFMAALFLDPKSVGALFSLAKMEMGRGEVEKARAWISRALAADPKFVQTYSLLLETPDFKPDDGLVTTLLGLAGNPENDPSGAVAAHYCLAKVYRSANRDLFIEHVTAANALQNGIAGHSTDKNALGFAAAKKVFTPKVLKTVAPEKFKRITPVFLVGNPRTGSTLVEQMLSGHSKVFAADEVHFVNTKLIKRCEELTKSPYPEGIEKLTPDQLGEIGKAYQDRMAEIAPDKPVMTDKMLSNAYFCGLIYKTMPWAKFIHMRRNALDMALSIFSNPFSETLPHTFNLKAMGKNFRLIQSAMAFWKQHLPDAILEVEYETLIENPEAEMKRVLKFCGLDWQPGVLDFHKASRPVQTLSLAQVNRPIFTSSVGKWKDYADLLEPFRAEVSDLIDKDGFLKS